MAFVEKFISEDMEKSDYELIALHVLKLISKYRKQLNTASEVLEGAMDTVENVKVCVIDLITSYFSRFVKTFTTFPIYSSPTQPNLQLLIDIYSGFHKLFKHIDMSKADQLHKIFADKITNKLWVSPIQYCIFSVSFTIMQTDSNVLKT